MKTYLYLSLRKITKSTKANSSFIILWLTLIMSQGRKQNAQSLRRVDVKHLSSSRKLFPKCTCPKPHSVALGENSEIGILRNLLR